MEIRGIRFHDNERVSVDILRLVCTPLNSFANRINDLAKVIEAYLKSSWTTRSSSARPILDIVLYIVNESLPSVEFHSNKVTLHFRDDGASVSILNSGGFGYDILVEIHSPKSGADLGLQILSKAESEGVSYTAFDEEGACLTHEDVLKTLYAFEQDSLKSLLDGRGDQSNKEVERRIRDEQKRLESLGKKLR